jgi:hypothetical protein
MPFARLSRVTMNNTFAFAVRRVYISLHFFNFILCNYLIINVLLISIKNAPDFN